MHFQTLVLLALSAGALAIPSSLSPRKHDSDPNPSIAPYNDGDCTQQAGLSHDFGQDKGHGCIKIDWLQDNVGINWGDEPWGMSAFYVFLDDACTDYAWARINNTNMGDDAKGANACYSMHLHGGPWKSVREWFPSVE